MLGQISLPKDGRLGAETMPANLLISVEVATQENQKKFLGTVGGGAIGLALLGPLGAIGGMLLGGNKTSVTFVGTLGDDRTFVASADASTFAKLKAIATKASAERARIVARTPPRPQVAVPPLTRASPSADQFRLQIRQTFKRLGWEVLELPRRVGSRYTVIVASKANRSIGVAVTDDLLDAYNVGLMSNAMRAAEGGTTQVSVGASVRQGAIEFAKQQGVHIAASENAHTLLDSIIWLPWGRAHVSEPSLAMATGFRSPRRYGGGGR
jgi:hypothetical protein